MDNMTAKVSCFARAYHYKNNSTHIFADNIAEELLGDDYNQIKKSMTGGLDFFCPGFKGTKEEGLRVIVDKQLSPSVLGRSAFCEDKLKDNITNGCRQCVVFAAGYDTFSLRNSAKSLIVFELDYPQMIEDKLERINKVQRTSAAICVPCNLADKIWKNKLLAHGYDKNKKAFGSLLGISYYLKKEDFGQLIMNISEIMSEGSVICFDYPSVDESAEARKTQMLASGAGEQMKALYSYKEIDMILDQHGFIIEEYLDENDMTYRYFREYNQANPMHQMNAPVGVGYVYAVKR